MTLIGRRGLRMAFLVLTLFTLLAGDAWRYTVGWTGFIVVVVVLTVGAIVLLVRHHGSSWFNALPYPLLAFLALATLSIAWSFYPGASALGVLATLMTATGAIAVGMTYSWQEILRCLGIALRIILGLSLVFEFVVALAIRRPVLPFVPEPGIDYSRLPDPVPLMLYWSRNELFQVFDGGKIQGIVGNSALLSFVALLGLIVFAIQWADKTVRRGPGAAWLIVAVACVAFTRSATNLLGLAAVALVVITILLFRGASTVRARAMTVGAAFSIVVGVTTVALVFSRQFLEFLGKSPDLTNRTDIWNAVIALAQERPVQGWGWVSYWVPWVAPFDTLAENNGVRQLHAHNAWLDIWFQLGIIGLVVFGALVLSTLARSWNLAVDRPQWEPGIRGAYQAKTLLPLLVVVALIVQSLAESRLLVEYGFFLLALIAIKTKDPRATELRP